MLDIDNILLSISREVSEIKENIRHLPTRNDLQDAVHEHSQRCNHHARPWSAKKIVAIGSIITALGGAIAAVLVVL